jgi:hypothetical protein
VYSNENYYLGKYLKESPVDIPNHWDAFLKWSRADDVLERVGVDRELLEEAAEEHDDTFYEMCDKIEKSLTDEEKSSFGDFMSHWHNAEAPTWAHVSLEKYRLPRQTWLIHFSDQAHKIQKEGFKYGVDQVDRLALTTWLHENEKKYGGYNFAFVAGNKASLQAGSKFSYGKEAVMFQSSGVEIYHYGDEENQVIFWGQAIDPRMTVHLSSDGHDWIVVPGWKATSRALKDRGEIYRGTLENVIDWVERNWQQYRKQIFGKRYLKVEKSHGT